MKSATMWLTEESDIPKDVYREGMPMRSFLSTNESEHNDEHLIEWIKSIQLDAMKEGMRRAAEMNQYAIDFCGDSECEVCSNFRMRKEAILTSAEQLTEKDL